MIAAYVDRLQHEVEAAKVAPVREAGDLLTADQIAGIISDTLKDGYNSGKLTGADAKGLTQTLRELLPSLFGSNDDTDIPNPAALMAYITGFSGRQGADIVQELGGREFMQARLSEILHIPVILPD